jgi:hypothetical protein
MNVNIADGLRKFITPFLIYKILLTSNSICVNLEGFIFFIPRCHRDAELMSTTSCVSSKKKKKHILSAEYCMC